MSTLVIRASESTAKTFDRYEREALALLSTRTVDQLKDDYRTAYRMQETDPDASEARRLVCLELLRRMSRQQVATFERSVLGH